MPWITRPQVYRMVREMLPRRTLGPEELLRWLEDVQLRNERAQPPPTRSAEPTNNTQPSHPHNPVVVMLEESKENETMTSWKEACAVLGSGAL